MYSTRRAMWPPARPDLTLRLRQARAYPELAGPVGRAEFGRRPQGGWRDRKSPEAARRPYGHESHEQCGEGQGDAGRRAGAGAGLGGRAGEERGPEPFEGPGLSALAAPVACP